jgi:pimeloyl-ACP methyl ester carboxylesterase
MISSNCIGTSEGAPDIPVLILTGSEDIIAKNSWRVRKRWPFAQNIYLKDCEHFPWLERPKEFYSIICQYYDVEG